MGTRYEEGEYVKEKGYSSDKIYEVVAIHSPESNSPDYEITSVNGESSKPSIIKKASDLKKADMEEVVSAIREENDKLKGSFDKGDRVEIIEPSMPAEKGTIIDIVGEPFEMGGATYLVRTDNHGEGIYASTDLELEGRR